MNKNVCLTQIYQCVNTYVWQARVWFRFPYTIGISIGEQVSDNASKTQLMWCIICVFFVFFIVVVFVVDATSILCSMACKPSWQLYTFFGYEKCVVLIWVLRCECVAGSENMMFMSFIQYFLQSAPHETQLMWKRINFDSVLTVKYWAFNKELTYMT